MAGETGHDPQLAGLDEVEGRDLAPPGQEELLDREVQQRLGRVPGVLAAAIDDHWRMLLGEHERHRVRRFQGRDPVGHALEARARQGRRIERAITQRWQQPGRHTRRLDQPFQDQAAFAQTHHHGHSDGSGG